jgi:hypothetical protein
MVKIVLSSRPDEKMLISDSAFRMIIVNDNKEINPRIVWADGTEEELLRFWLNESAPKPKKTYKDATLARPYNPGAVSKSY